MKELFDKAKKLLTPKVDSLIDELNSSVNSGMKMVSEVINGLPVFVSFERTLGTTQKYDEKHYFVIPYHLSDVGFSLHTMRSLPDGIPEINNLPKRRIFHFPNEHFEATLRDYMVNSAKELAYEDNAALVNPLEKLADDIDALDSKLTYGMLLIGGLAAIFNPIVGVGIAAKALLPSVTGLLTKYGLRPVGEKLTRSQIEKKAKEAENHLLKQFSESTTLKVTNPILAELEFTLRTTEEQHDPLQDPNLSVAGIKQLDTENWRQLTEIAIYHVYKETYENPEMHQQAKLGPKNIRWLDVMFTGMPK